MIKRNKIKILKKKLLSINYMINTLQEKMILIVRDNFKKSKML